MLVEEGTYISNHKVELLNSKNQVKVIRTSTRCQVVPGADISEEEELELEDDDEHTCKEARGPEDRRKLSLGSTCSCRSDQDIYIVFSIRLTTIQATYPVNRSPLRRLSSFSSPYCQLSVL